MSSVTTASHRPTLHSDAAACSQSPEHQVFAQLEGGLVPEVHDHRALELPHALKDQPRHDAEVPTRSVKMLWTYAETLYRDDCATLEDLREAVTTLEEVERPTQRVFGISHPLVTAIEYHLRLARAALHARKTRVS